MRMTCTSFYAILRKCWQEHVMKHLVTMAERKGCHGGETKMVPRQHIRKWCHGNISVPVAHGDTSAKGKVTGASHARWWGAPEYRVPTCRRQGNKELAKNNSDTVQPRASHTSLNIRSRASSRHYTLEACVSRRFKNVEGSSHSRVVVEVVVHIP